MWQLWANGVYISIGFFRGHPKFSQSGQPGEQEPASYLFNIKIQNEAEYLLSNIDIKANENWQQTWATTAAALKKERAELEAGMRKTDTPAKHWNWDTEYRDPPILALEAMKLRAKVGQPAPQAGWWTASLRHDI